MDLESLKAQASEAASRLLMEKHGFVPEEESDEFQDEYRRQFALIKARPPAQGKSGGGRPLALPPLKGGPPSDARWAETLREERLADLPNEEMRAWVARSWVTAKAWLETRDLPAPAFRRRVEAQYGDVRRRAETEASALKAEQAAKAQAAAAIAAKIRAAGITVAGLIELVDLSPRTKPLPPKGKLAELHDRDRRVRVFETADEAVLLVLESGDSGRSEYGIERDDGLVADLKLFAQAAQS